MKHFLFRLTLALAVTGALLCFLPVLTDEKVDLMLKSDAIISLDETLSSTTFQFSQALSISAALPIVFDLVMDMIYFSKQNMMPGRFAIWTLLISAILPNIIIFSYVIPQSKVELLILFPSCKIILVVFSALWLLNIYGPLIWRWQFIFPIMLCHSISTCASCFLPFVDSETVNTIYIVKIIFSTAAACCMVFIVFLWCRHLKQAKRDSKQLSPDDICCTLNFLAFSVMMVLTSAIQVSFGDYSSGKAGPNSFIWRVNFITVYVIIIAGLNCRYERAKMIINHFYEKVSVLDLLDSLINCGYEAVDILNSLLTFEKLDQGNLRLNTAPLRVNLFIKNLCEGRGDRVKLSMNFPTEALDGSNPSVFRIHADEKLFDNVIQNLITNALECTPREIPVTVDVTVIREEMSLRMDNCHCCPRMSIDATVLADNSYTLQIAVKDSGCGLTEEQLESAFKNPFSFTAGVLQTHQGQGLGLWISKKILELHGGSLTVQSDGIGRGTTHIIHMPVHIKSTHRMQSSSDIWSSVDLQPIRNMSLVSMFHYPSADASHQNSHQSDLDDVNTRVDVGDDNHNLEDEIPIPSIRAIGNQINDTHTSRSLLNPYHLDSTQSVSNVSPLRTVLQMPSTCVPEVPRLSERFQNNLTTR
eukprot:gene13000-27436_t